MLSTPLLALLTWMWVGEGRVGADPHGLRQPLHRCLAALHLERIETLLGFSQVPVGGHNLGVEAFECAARAAAGLGLP